MHTRVRTQCICYTNISSCCRRASLLLLPQGGATVATRRVTGCTVAEWLQVELAVVVVGTDVTRSLRRNDMVPFETDGII